MPLISEREKPSRNEALKYYRKVVQALGLKVRQFEEVRKIEQTAVHRFRVRTAMGEYAANNVVLATGNTVGFQHAASPTQSGNFRNQCAGSLPAGSVIGGRFNAEVFIENGRFHGETVVKAIAAG